MRLSAVLLLTVVMTIYIGPLRPTKVLEEYNSLPTTQTASTVPQKCWNYQYL